MIEKRVAILQQDDAYVAGVFTSRGLYAVNLPSISLEQAIARVGANNLEKGEYERDMMILEKVFKIMKGMRVNLHDIKFDFSGLTSKQIQVLRATLNIPFGRTKTYGEVARDAGLPNAARFVGTVMANNRLPPIVPCHRVVARNGLGNYSAGDGLSTKMTLLRLEGAIRGVISQNPLF